MKPKNNTRGLLAIIIVLIITSGLMYMAITGSQEALIVLVAEFSTVVGFYFGERSGKANK